MSPDVKAQAGVAKGTGTPPGPEVELTIRGHRGRAGPPPFDKATAGNIGRGEGHAARAAALREEERLSVPMIGRRMALDDGRPVDRPYSDRTVYKWLAAGRKKG